LLIEGLPSLRGMFHGTRKRKSGKIWIVLCSEAVDVKILILREHIRVSTQPEEKMCTFVTLPRQKSTKPYLIDLCRGKNSLAIKLRLDKNPKSRAPEEKEILSGLELSLTRVGEQTTHGKENPDGGAGLHFSKGGIVPAIHQGDGATRRGRLLGFWEKEPFREGGGGNLRLKRPTPVC